MAGGIAATVMTADGTWSGAAGRRTASTTCVDSQFGIASGTKPIVAAQVMPLVEAGEVDARRPATDYLPANFTFDTNGATIRQLLSHRSGIPDWYGDMEEQFAVDRLRVWEPDEVLALVDPARRPVGVWEYADTNYNCSGSSSSTSAGARSRRPARWRPPRRRDGAAHLPARRGTDRPDGHAARRSRDALEQGGGYLPSISDAAVVGGRAWRPTRSRSPLVAGVLRRRDRFTGLADRDVTLYDNGNRLWARAVPSRGFRVRDWHRTPRGELRLQVGRRLYDRGPLLLSC